MMVMMMAITPSVKASRRCLLTVPLYFPESLRLICLFLCFPPTQEDITVACQSRHWPMTLLQKIVIVHASSPVIRIFRFTTRGEEISMTKHEESRRAFLVRAAVGAGAVAG